jgi:hypothetical protein
MSKGNNSYFAGHEQSMPVSPKSNQQLPNSSSKYKIQDKQEALEGFR